MALVWICRSSCTDLLIHILEEVGQLEKSNHLRPIYFGVYPLKASMPWTDTFSCAPTSQSIWNTQLRYVGVIRFFFPYFSNFYKLELHNVTCGAFTNLHLSIIKNGFETGAFLDLLMVYWKCMFVDSLVEYVGPPFCVHYWLWSSPISFNHISLWCLFFDPQQAIYPIKCRCPIKKSNRITPTYLSMRLFTNPNHACRHFLHNS